MAAAAAAPPEGGKGDPSLQDAVPAETAPPAETTAVATTLVETTVPLVNELPEGGLNLAGQVPNCSKVTVEVYECWLPSSFDPAGDAVYPTGIAEYYVNDSSLVEGGCRNTSTDARQWVCYTGQRAVVENIIIASLLGDWQPNAYAAG